MARNVYEPKKPAIVTTSKGLYEERHKACVGDIEQLFSKRTPILSLWQEIAENFYPERADFTLLRSIGNEFADHLSTSSPLIICRDLGNSLSAMLRPPGTAWAHMTTDRPDDELDNESRAWLQSKTKVMFRAINDTAARFDRATSEADHDFAAFGQAVISCEVNLKETTLLYRCWHLRDVAWKETYDGSIGKRGRKWKPCASELAQLFPNSIHPKVKLMLTSNNGKDAYREVECRHVIIPSAEYEYMSGKRNKFPYVSLYVDLEHQHVMEERGSLTGHYIIPRWKTVSGTQYAHSPATVAALPDARLLQAMTFTLLKAGEKAVDPPMIATSEMIKSPIDIQPGGVTWVDSDYDERSGEVLRPMTVDSKGIPVGFNMQERITQEISSAFYLDKMRLPPMMAETTAFEIAQRLQEYIRQALPLFGPIEREYNAPLCEDTFTLLMANGTFGGVDNIPEMLRGSNIRFRFDSPLVDANDQQLVQTFQDTANILQIAAGLDPAAAQIVNAQVALRDTLNGRQVPAKWLRSEDEMAQITEQVKAEQEAAKQAAQIQQGGMAAEQVGLAGQAINEATKPNEQPVQ